MILQECLCYYLLHKWDLDLSNFEMLRFVIYVHLYHVYLNISNLLEVVSMHKHCSNHFRILGFKMSIIAFIENLVNFALKLFLIQTFIPTSLKWCFSHIQMGMNHMCQSHTTLHYLTFDFDFCLTFSWIFFFLHINISLCLLSASLIFD